ncbi:Ig-like protein group 2 [Herbinix hemicellulosilytica]|uniref:BIG2 domain-containing protein n=1 Tax=Herbinix hemicellulosilytica TaxID=1564487 RepID=A0A0H5SD67_HERHM|nr:Ig-like domain-containing protein [Herbinix hemicellulosilytica]RBP57798.1 Ig-like protein group 2 [Herbinix hemicellulosilytica]CRZ33369.1 hypothetical protein HHT355_0155 [Herbinix hemicellulosilytica]
MKTKFFKKLSFVLAVAMVLSVLYPAAGAFAAKKPKLNATSKYLHLDVEGKNEYDFNISNKQKGWKYDWESADEDVVVVDNKGVVTATGVGKTKVTVYITDKDGEEVAKLSAKVTVRDNIKEVKISNPPEGKLEVGQEYDFNRSFVTVSGSTKKTSAITRWTVEPSDTATIDDKGVFKATKAGKYTITARSFQSKEKYEYWLSDNEAYKDYVLATDSVEVTVAASMVEAKQYDLSKVNVLFTSPMTEEEVKNNIYVHYMIGDVAVKEQEIKSVKISDDGMTATVEIYDTFVPKVTYKVTYTDMEPVSFIAATANPEDVKGIDITTSKVTVFEPTRIKYNLINENGVIINQPVDVNNLGVRVTFESSNELTSLYNDELTIFNKGDVTTVKATYHTYEWVDGQEIVYTDTQAIVGVEEADVLPKGILAWTIVKHGETPKYDKVNHFIAAEDNDRVLNVKIELSDGSKISSHDDNLIKLTSSDSSVLFVDETGYLVPVKEGKVRVTVEYDNKYVGSFEVTVSAKRKAARMVVEDAVYSLSNYDEHPSWSDKVTVNAYLKDQYGYDFEYEPDLRIRALSQKAIDRDGKEEKVIGGNSYTFDPKGEAEGRYQYLVYDAAYPTITAQVTFDVKAPNSEAVTWKVEISGAYKDGKIDTVVKAPEDANKKFSIQLMGYAKNGVKVGPEDLSEYNVTIKDNKGKELKDKAPEAITDDNSIYNATYNATWTAATGSAISTKIENATWTAATGSAIGTKIEKLENGQYTVEIIDKNKTVKGRAVFTVVDTQKLPELEIKGFRSANTDGDQAFADAFTVKLNGSAVSAERLAPQFKRTQVPTRAYADKVLVTEYIKDADGNETTLYIVHELKVGYYITVPVDFASYVD